MQRALAGNVGDVGTASELRQSLKQQAQHQMIPKPLLRECDAVFAGPGADMIDFATRSTSRVVGVTRRFVASCALSRVSEVLGHERSDAQALRSDDERV
jgi:hypothetical protein